MPTKPRRRWFRFGLRTMFVVVTVFSVWLGWQAKIVRDRREALAKVLANGGQVFDAVWHEPTVTPGMCGVALFDGTSPVAIPVWRTWLGDSPIEAIVLIDPSPEQIDRMQSQFPESAIVSDKPPLPGSGQRFTR